MINKIDEYERTNMSNESMELHCIGRFSKPGYIYIYINKINLNHESEFSY